MPTALLAKKRRIVNAHLRAALRYARLHLSDIRRQSGESYAEHCMELQKTVAEVSSDPSVLSAALLHDLLMHVRGMELLRDSPLDPDEQRLVLGMHQLRKLHIDRKTADLDVVVEAFASDPRIALLRMAHRLNDVRHLDRFPWSRQKVIAHETLHMYTAIAERLGYHAWRSEMEDKCFLILHPRMARRVQKLFKDSRSMDIACLRHAKTFLQQKLAEANLRAILDERIKGLYSTYRKMVIKKRRYHELTDRLALRILVDDVDDCYRTLGVVHGCMHAIPGKLKDYIGSPKANGYQSIHTVVYPLPGITDLPIEIQIRTHEMHRRCEFGMSAHDTYKLRSYALTERPARTNLFRNLEILRANARTPRQFEQVLRHYFGGGTLLLFDALSNIYHLPRPATPLDFAILTAKVHWKQIAGCKVNGRRSALDTELHDGDVVEIMEGRNTQTLRQMFHACKQKEAKRMLKEQVRTIAQQQILDAQKTAQ